MPKQSQKQPEARSAARKISAWNDLLRFERFKRLKILHSDASSFVGQVKELIIVLSKSANAS